MPGGAYIFVPVVFCVALFSFLTVAVWLKVRLKERESYYRSETIKRIAEASGAGIGAALDFFREQETKITRQRRESRKLTGLVSVGLGIALTVVLKAYGPNEPDYLVGLFPLLFGSAYLIYVYVLAPKEK